MKNLKINLRKMAFLMSALTFSLVGCSKKEDSKGVVEIVQEVENDTCFDEVVSENMLFEVEKLEEYLKKLDELDNLNFDYSVVDVRDTEIMDIEQLEVYINIYKTEHKNFVPHAKDRFNNIFTTQRKLINEYIDNHGYDTMLGVCEVLIKAKMVDTINKPLTFIDAMKIPSSNDFGIRIPNLDYITLECQDFPGIFVKDNLALYDLTTSYYEMKKKGDIFEEELDKNSSRNLINKAIINVKNTLYEEYDMDNIGHLNLKKSLFK